MCMCIVYTWTCAFPPATHPLSRSGGSLLPRMTDRKRTAVGRAPCSRRCRRPAPHPGGWVPLEEPDLTLARRLLRARGAKEVKAWDAGDTHPFLVEFLLFRLDRARVHFGRALRVAARSARVVRDRREASSERVSRNALQRRDPASEDVDRVGEEVGELLRDEPASLAGRRRLLHPRPLLQPE